MFTIAVRALRLLSILAVLACIAGTGDALGQPLQKSQKPLIRSCDQLHLDHASRVPNEDTGLEFSHQHIFYHPAKSGPGSSHILASGPLTQLRVDDVTAQARWAHNPLNVKSTRVELQAPMRTLALRYTSAKSDSDVKPFNVLQGIGPDLELCIINISAPDITDKPTVINLAKMTSDAYYPDPSTPGWLNTTFGFNSSSAFGWSEDGLRGHVFTNPTNSTVIIAFKGTSVDPRDTWSSNDRLNDNLLFSCCCAAQRPDPYWYAEVCSCRTETYRCNSTCLNAELARKDRYYAAAVQVYQNISAKFPDSRIWTTGHSMGGAMASLIGLTFATPSVSFESLPQRLPAQRLGLFIPPSHHRAAQWHFGHTADPVFMGACNGFSSSCAIGGYAFESQCFTGLRCAYDTVGDKGWRMSINTHRINNVIPQVLEDYDEVATCEADEECGECYNWYFDNSSTTARDGRGRCPAVIVR